VTLWRCLFIIIRCKWRAKVGSRTPEAAAALAHEAYMQYLRNTQRKE
jgi:hypothetical protein